MSKRGDSWNGEDLSIVTAESGELLPRAIQAWSRPYPVETMGRLREFSFDISTTIFSLSIDIISYSSSTLWQECEPEVPATEGHTVIYLPYTHYLRCDMTDTGDNRVIGRPDPQRVDLRILEISEGRLEIAGQWARWYYSLERDHRVTLKVAKW